MTKILVIDDDEEVINIINLTFRVGWPEAAVISARLGGIGLELLEAELPNLVILDLGLPDMSGFAVLKDIRRFSDVPIVILTASEDEIDVVKGLELGANEYVVKPFRQMEFLARVKSAAGTLRKADAEEIYYNVGPFRFFPSLRKLESDSEHIMLTPTESTILLQLVRNKSKPVSYACIAQKLWVHDYPGAAEAIRVYVNNLRRKIESDPALPKFIVTVPGIGYSLSSR